jgi:hypothetical protein
MPREVLGLLVIRARLEQGSSSPLRAEVRATKDVSTGFEGTLNLSNVDSVVEAVRDWLQHIVREGFPQVGPAATDGVGGAAPPSTKVDEA